MHVSLRNAVFGLISGVVFCGSALAQAKPPAIPVPPPVVPSAGVIYRSHESLEALGKQLTAAAKAGTTGISGVTLDKPAATHFTMLTTRSKSGGAELHKKAADMFVVMDGEGTLITGGTIVDLQDSGDEVKGTRVEGGASQIMRKGDVVMIAPNTPHQTIVAPGKTFTYLVVKVVSQ
jgi:mannose-6-phosphate isomerase-like protein (cupin superfamily)